MKATISIALSAMLLLLAYTATANTVGFTYSQIADDRSIGFTGDYETQLTDRVKFEANGNIQAGDIYNAVLNTDFTFDISAVDLKILIQNKAKGYTLPTLGREQSVSLAFTLPVDNLNFDIGVGGQNANPFGTPNAFDTLTTAGFAEADISSKGLESLTPAPTGIPLQDGSALNAFVSTGFAKSIFDIDVKGVIQLVSEDDRMHQIVLNFKTGGKVRNINIVTNLEFGLASYQDAIHYESAVITSAGFDF